VTGLISYVKNVIDETFPKEIINPPIEVEMSDYQFKQYENARKERKNDGEYDVKKN